MTTEAELTALQDTWIAAEIAGDTQTLERILDERFLATFSSGKTIDRKAFVGVVADADIAPFTVVTERIEVHGDTAVVIDLSEDGRTKFTWIAVKRNGGWRVISETFSKMTAPD